MFIGKILFIEQNYQRSNVSICLRALINTIVLQGLTGMIAFNDHGDRLESLYEIINIQQQQSQVVGNYRSNTVKQKLNKISFEFLFLLCLDRLFNW